MKSFFIRLTMLAIVFSLLPGALLAEGRFKGYDFELEGEVTDVINEDVNGDGLLDILIVHINKNTDPPSRYLTILPHDRDKGFDRARMVRWEFPREVAAVDVGDISPEPGRELVFITEKGVYSAGIENWKVGELREVIAVQSVVAIPYDKDVPYYNFVRDYTGDGLDDILVYGFYDALIAIQGPDYAFTRQRLNIRPGMDIDAFDFMGLMGTEDHPMFRVAYYVPTIYSEDYNADGRVDMIINYQGDVKIFAADGSGFSEDPVAHYKIKVFKEDETPSHRRGYANIDFRDFDGDGRVDIIANQVKGRIGKFQARTILFWGSSPNIGKGVPDFEFTTAKTAMGMFVQDVNNDGLLDVRLSTLDLNAWTAGKALLTGEFTFEDALFIQRPDRKFNQTPDRLIPTNLEFSITKFRLESGIPNSFGDFNGDGFPDQVMGESESVLMVTIRDKEGFSTDLVEKIEVPVSMITRAVDLNGDGLSDLLVHYREREEHTGEIHLFLNQGGWTRPE